MKETVRIGQISSIDYKNGRAKVTYPDRDDDVTAALPFLAYEYMMPKSGDDVLVLHLSNDGTDGVIIGKMYSSENLPKKYGKGTYDKMLDTVSEIYSKDGAMEITADTLKFTCKTGSITLAEIISHIKGA